MTGSVLGLAQCCNEPNCIFASRQSCCTITSQLSSTHLFPSQTLTAQLSCPAQLPGSAQTPPRAPSADPSRTTDDEAEKGGRAIHNPIPGLGPRLSEQTASS